MNFNSEIEFPSRSTELEIKFRKKAINLPDSFLFRFPQFVNDFSSIEGFCRISHRCGVIAMYEPIRRIELVQEILFCFVGRINFSPKGEKVKCFDGIRSISHLDGNILSFTGNYQPRSNKTTTTYVVLRYQNNYSFGSVHLFLMKISHFRITQP